MLENLNTVGLVYDRLVKAELEAEKAAYMEALDTMTREDIEDDLAFALQKHKRIKSSLAARTDEAAKTVAKEIVDEKHAVAMERDLKMQLKKGDVLKTLKKIDDALGALESAGETISDYLATKDNKDSDKAIDLPNSLTTGIRNIVSAPLKDEVVKSASQLQLEVAKAVITHQQARLTEVRRHLKVVAELNRRFQERDNAYMKFLMMPTLRNVATDPQDYLSLFQEIQFKRENSRSAAIKAFREANARMNKYWEDGSKGERTIAEFLVEAIKGENSKVLSLEKSIKATKDRLAEDERLQNLAKINKVNTERAMERMNNLVQLEQEQAGEFEPVEVAELAKQKKTLSNELKKLDEEAKVLRLRRRIEISTAKRKELERRLIDLKDQLQDALDDEPRIRQEAVAALPSNLAIILFVERPLDMKAEISMSSELHRHSIYLSQINVRQRETLILQLTESLHLYHKGGIKPEEVARLLFSAIQATGIVAIATTN